MNTPVGAVDHWPLGEPYWWACSEPERPITVHTYGLYDCFACMVKFRADWDRVVDALSRTSDSRRRYLVARNIEAFEAHGLPPVDDPLPAVAGATRRHR